MANWRSFAPSWTKGTSRTHAQGKRGNRRKQLSHRSLQLQPLEERTVFAVGGGPTLLAIIPNEGALIVPNGPSLHIAPKDLTFRFDDGQVINPASLGAIQITRSGPDRVLGNSDDVTITPGFVGIGETPNDVIVRFADTLPDDLYQVTIIGTGANPLRNAGGQPLDGGTLTRTFRLDLGAQITAVVPQPMSRDAQGKLVQATNQIDIYFNDDNLNFNSAQNTTFYELILTQGTLSNADDLIFNPTSVSYDASADKAVLNFPAGVLSTPGTWRLRVGNNDVTPTAPVTQPVPTDPGSTLTTAQNVGSLGTAGQTTQSLILNSAIDAQPYTVLWPGGNDEPGHRDIPLEAHLGGGDTAGGIPRIPYNFQLNYGSDPFGNPLFNVITDNQKQRAREIFALYGYYLGVQFYETPTSGLTIATGDIRAVDPTATTGPGGIAGIAGGGLAVMDNAENWGVSDYGGAWMSVAMHEIGHLLGQGHTYDLPAQTIQGSDPQFGSTEAFFPGVQDIVHGQRLYRPDSKDIDLYKFSLNQAGKVSLETLAERLNTGDSGLDSVVTVFDSNGVIMGRNDDYFSKDSYLELNLTAGQYYVAVTSTGNTSFDPKVDDSGMLGTTQGNYSLRINFTPDATGGLVDANGTMFDGDADGIPGGAYNFWFKTQSAANTLFVDKVATGGVGTLGSITNPYTNISLALAAASPGQIVRIVGNGGTDGNIATINDNVAYNIGRDIFGSALSDGQRMDIPRNVTVMVDAGAIIKLRGANIEAGSQNSGVDRSGGALQVLGTPARNASGQDIGSVIITSFHNESVGTNSDNRVTTPGKGDWGGLVFRDDSDLEQFGIFLSYVNHAKISYGGGQVPLSPTSPTFDPIHLIKARPNISFNTITNSSGAAMSADPDSFEETKFQDTTFTADYGRVGPAIHGNIVVTNTINGIFVRIRTLSNESIDLMTVPARFDDTDIVHVISENLIIKGSAGGGLQDPFTGVIAARLNGRLKIDPGMIVKLDGARIETQFDAQVIAEGTASNRVIMTSLADDKYGAGGTFDTPNNGAIGSVTNVLPAAGNWGGLFFGPTSSGNLDFALVTYGGGSTSVEGGFDNFNAVEIHQADVRIANSIIENSAGGAGGNRAGRGGNAAATIFTLFSHPVLVNNIIRNNAAAAISIDVNSLGYQDQNDTGRTSGRIALAGNFMSNQGPLVNGNKLLNNGTNGMIVRGGPMLTDGVWDDSDIVHVVQTEIIIPDHHTYSGLRLESNPTQSLVVKLQGATAGFTADGRPLDIDDRIGGTLQVVGRPGYPVVFTSLADDSVGAGFDPTGKPVTDTNNNGPSTGTAGDWRSLRLDSMSNDRNVAVVNESEQTFAPGGDLNGIPENSQYVGGLAPNERSGDDNVRLGFEIHGLISEPGDVDVYRFSARAGTEVWLDIDRTSFALDTILELIDASGAVIARSDNSRAEEANPGLLVGAAGTAYTMNKSDFGFPDLYSMNTQDAGLRVVLPTGPDTINDYFVRVRSASSNLTNLTGGLSQGTYQLQIRLGQTDEKPGSVIGFADVRYASAGIEVLGKPEHSPILSESTETTANNDLYTTAQDLGNLMLSDRGTLSSGGNISGVTDVDWFRFDLTYDLVQNLTPGAKTLATMFDIDYADGLARPDTTMAVFDGNGQLILIARDSNVADDQPPPAVGDAGKSDLDRGSFSKLDPYIGTVQLPETFTYYVAVFSNRQLPAVMDANFRGTATSPLTRLEPINSVNRIAEDHIGYSGGSTLNPPATTLFPGGSASQILTTAAEPYTLGDVPFYVMTGGAFFTKNAFTGAAETNVSGALGLNYGDIVMRSDGRLFGLTVPTVPPTDANSGNFVEFSPADGAQTNIGDDNIVTYQIDPATGALPPVVHNIGVQFDGMAYYQPGGTGSRQLFAIGHRAPGNGVDVERNLLYRLNPNTGAAIDFLTPNNPRMPTDAIQLDGGPGRPLVTAPTIITNDVTDTTGNTANPGDVRDGITFTINDGINPSRTFELDTGPDILFTTPAGAGSNLQNDILFRDGETFTLNATTYEFNSGPVLVVAGPGSNFIDGQAFTITDTNNISKTFEYDSDNTLINAANQRIAFTSGDSALQVAASTSAAINAAGLTVVATRANSLTTRITLTNDTTVTPISPVSPQPTLALDGNYGISPGRTAINFEETDAAGVIGPAIANATAAFGGSYARNRVNFSGATSSNFAGLLPPNTGGAPLDPTPISLNTNVLGGTAAPGVLTPGAVRVPIRAAQDADQLAIVLQNAINGQTSATFRVASTAFGTSVSLRSTSAVPATTSLVVNNGGTVITSFGSGPGGDVTGLAVLNGVMYAVSSGGGLFTVDNALLTQNGPINNTQLNYITNSSSLTGIQFSSLTIGPQTVENGRYANMLFATSTSGRLYAIDPNAATPAAMLQPVFAGGATSVQLAGAAGAVGIAFSPVDYNLWHLTDKRGFDAGHGVNSSIDNDAARGAIGGTSFYFGLETPSPLVLNPQPGAGNFATNIDPITGNNAVFDTYNVPNGANGKISTSTFSLEGYASGDKPTLYFNYYLETQNANSAGTAMRDAFRVQISNDGVNWTVIGTNNSVLSTPLIKAELGTGLYASGGVYRNERPDQMVQELFDNSGTWRQARVDLGDWAGQTNLRLRFDFVTAGSFNDGEFTDNFGNFFSNQKGQNNRFEGAYLDDVVIGFAERGEMVTSANGNTTNFFSTPVDPAPPGTQSLVGTYQLEIRRGTQYATQSPPAPPAIALVNGFDTNDRMVQGYTLVAADPSTIADGESFTLSDGLVDTRYEFDTNGSVTPGSVSVPIGTLTTASQVANAIMARVNVQANSKIRASVVPTSNRVDLSNVVTVRGYLSLVQTDPTENDNTIATAYDSGLSSALPGVLTKSSLIGDSFDNPYIPNNLKDTDFVKFQLNGGDSVDIDINTPGFSGSLPDSILRVFNAAGVELAFSDDDFSPSDPPIFTTDSYIHFTAPVTGTYYVGVSGYNNSSYNANVENSGVDGGVGTYDLVLTYQPGAVAIVQYGNQGDKNLFRDQGYTIVHDSKVSNSSGFGIVVDNAPRTVGNSLPHTSSPRTLTVPSTQNLVPGIAIKSNLIYNNAAGGILFSGDNNGSPTAAVPFGRILNNTIFGGTTASGIGISVTDRAGPTILNNILANNTTGVNVDASSGATTVLGANVYQANGTNRVGAGETFAVNAPASPSLFVNAGTGNFYLAQGAPAVDSAIDSLPERDSLRAVVEDVGIPQSPILAPSSDLFGQLRKDDDTTPNSGQGNIPFKDRGALERADFDGPIAAMFDPTDNDAAGVDRDAAVNSILIVGRSVSHFSVQITDPAGVGVDDATVVPGNFIITRDGTTLSITNDFLFSYDTTNKIVRIDAAAGIWIAGTYKIQLVNTASGIKDIAGNQLIPNNPNGNTEFTIVLSNAVAAPWQNPNNALDVNGDGFVSPIDALLVVNALNTLGGVPLPTPAVVPPYIDVNGDGNLSAIDLLLVVAQLNAAPVQLQAAPLSSSAIVAADSPAADDSSGDLAFAVSLASATESSSVSSGVSNTPVAASSSSSSAATSSEAVWQAYADENFDLDAGDLAVASLTSAEDDDDWNFEDILDG